MSAMLPTVEWLHHKYPAKRWNEIRRSVEMSTCFIVSPVFRRLALYEVTPFQHRHIGFLKMVSGVFAQPQTVSKRRLCQSTAIVRQSHQPKYGKKRMYTLQVTVVGRDSTDKMDEQVHQLYTVCMRL